MIDAAHQLDRPLILAGTDATPEAIGEARVNADVHLGPSLSKRDELLEALEAMAMGTPVVGYQQSVIAEQVINGRSGIIAAGPSGRVDAIAMADELDRAEVRATAKTRFALGEMVDAYERLFGRLLRGHG